MNTFVNYPDDDPSYIDTNEEAKPKPIEAPVPQQQPNAQPNTAQPQQPNVPVTQPAPQQPQTEAPKKTTYTSATKTEAPKKTTTSAKGAVSKGKASITTKGKK